MDKIEHEYYCFPTTVGDFYLYREYVDHGYNSGLGMNEISYSDFIEFFTGVSCGEIIKNETLDLKNRRDCLKFELIKDELSACNWDIDYNSNSDIINYNYLSFNGYYNTTKWGFESLPKYALFRGHANYVIEYKQNVVNKNYISNNYRITPVEFAQKLKKLIDKYGNTEIIKEIILEKMREKALENGKQEEYINNRLKQIEEENNKAEEYIKKYLKH